MPQIKNKPLNILLADDDELDRMLFTEAFEELRLSTRVATVNDGTTLLARLNDEQIPLPDFIFLDLNMPRMNGLQCLKEIRKDIRYSEIMIAIYSTSASEDDINETFINGANVYIKKPGDFIKLKQLLEKAVGAANIYQEPPFNKANFLLRL